MEHAGNFQERISPGEMKYHPTIEESTETKLEVLGVLDDLAKSLSHLTEAKIIDELLGNDGACHELATILLLYEKSIQMKSIVLRSSLVDILGTETQVLFGFTKRAQNKKTELAEEMIRKSFDAIKEYVSLLSSNSGQEFERLELATEDGYLGVKLGKEASARLRTNKHLYVRTCTELLNETRH